MPENFFNSLILEKKKIKILKERKERRILILIMETVLRAKLRRSHATLLDKDGVEMSARAKTTLLSNMLDGKVTLIKEHLLGILHTSLVEPLAESSMKHLTEIAGEILLIGVKVVGKQENSEILLEVSLLLDPVGKRQGKIV